MRESSAPEPHESPASARARRHVSACAVRRAVRALSLARPACRLANGERSLSRLRPRKPEVRLSAAEPVGEGDLDEIPEGVAHIPELVLGVPAGYADAVPVSVCGTIAPVEVDPVMLRPCAVHEVVVVPLEDCVRLDLDPLLNDDPRLALAFPQGDQRATVVAAAQREVM